MAIQFVSKANRMSLVHFDYTVVHTKNQSNPSKFEKRISSRTLKNIVQTNGIFLLIGAQENV